jgi:hypothetical protein
MILHRDLRWKEELNGFGVGRPLAFILGGKKMACLGHVDLLDIAECLMCLTNDNHHDSMLVSNNIVSIVHRMSNVSFLLYHAIRNNTLK